MPYQNGGCQTCRARRVKCDQVRPVCQRCLKSQRSCSWPDAGQGTLVVHVENNYVTGTLKRPRGPRSALIRTSPAPGTLLENHLTPNLQDRAIDCWLHQHLKPTSQRPADVRSISETLTDHLFVRLTDLNCPTFNLAVGSLALAIFSQTHSYRPAAQEASVKYSRLLRIMREKMSLLSSADVDKSLLVVFLMGRYEDAVYDPRKLEEIPRISISRSFLHHRGALAILRVWHDRFSAAQQASNIMKHSRRGLIWSALLQCCPLPEWLRDGDIYGENGLELDQDRILARLINVRYLFRVTKDKIVVGTPILEVIWKFNALLEEIRSIDEAAQKYIAQFSTHWGFQKLTLAKLQAYPRQHFFSPMVHVYKNYDYALLWNRYFSLRMLINSTGLYFSQSSYLAGEPCIKEIQLQYLKDIDEMAGNLASSIPYCLGRLERAESSHQIWSPDSLMINTTSEIKPYLASLVAWPLSIAANIEGVDLERKRWFESELAHVGRATGAGIFQYTNSAHWAQFQM